MAGIPARASEGRAMIRCLLGWHKPRGIKVATSLSGGSTVTQGCDRCGKTRVIVKSPWGRIVDVTRWT